MAFRPSNPGERDSRDSMPVHYQRLRDEAHEPPRLELHEPPHEITESDIAHFHSMAGQMRLALGLPATQPVPQHENVSMMHPAVSAALSALHEAATGTVETTGATLSGIARSQLLEQALAALTPVLSLAMSGHFPAPGRAMCDELAQAIGDVRNQITEAIEIERAALIDLGHIPKPPPTDDDDDDEGSS